MAKAKFYVYVHRRADSGEVFYVGKGSGQRAYCKSKRGSYWDRVVAKHGLDIEILERFEQESESFARECSLIAQYRAVGVALVNMTDGGEGASGAVRSDEVRRRMSEGKKGWKPPPDSDETRAKKRRSALGRPMSPEAIAKTAAARTGRKLPAATVAKIKATLKGRLTRKTPLTEQERIRLIEINRGKKMADEVKAKVSASKTGQKLGPQSEEHRAKIAEARKRYWARWRAEKAAAIAPTQ